MILIPLSCLAGIQTSPVYFYKHFSFYGFTDNCNSFLLNQSILQLYSCVSVLYFLKIIKNLFFKKDRIKENENNLSDKIIIKFFIFSSCLYFIIAFFSFFLINNNTFTFSIFANNYFFVTYILSFLYFSNFINVKTFTLFIYFFIFFF